ncbi:AmmeMemoRadiSam system protein B [Desulfoplanes sp.]
MDRQPIVAGQFYPSGSRELGRHLKKHIPTNGAPSQQPTILAMLPHAGYIYSGDVAGRTIGRSRLNPSIILLGPSHTGEGAPIGLWPDGCWIFPGGRLCVDQSLAQTILESSPAIASDYASHKREHSLEVQLPFLHAQNPHCSIVPITIADPRPDVLEEVGTSLARAIKMANKPVSLVVSSDMSHYISADAAKKLDTAAIDQILALSPRGLYQTVRDKRISMCGILPMTAGLTAALELGASNAYLTRYATSGDVNGDYDQVVGYAGIIVE